MNPAFGHLPRYFRGTIRRIYLAHVLDDTMPLYDVVRWLIRAQELVLAEHLIRQYKIRPLTSYFDVWAEEFLDHGDCHSPASIHECAMIPFCRFLVSQGLDWRHALPGLLLLLVHVIDEPVKSEMVAFVLAEELENS